MSNLAAAGGKLLIDNGRERRTDGLLKHLGQIDTSSLRVGGLGGHPALTGAGVETIFFNTPPATANGTIQCFDRDAQAYRDLAIVGRSITLTPQSGGTLNFPNGSITTPMLAANAAQQRIGAYASGTGWSSGGVLNTWIETPLNTGAIACSGAECRIEWSFSVNNNGAANSGNYFGIGWDGGMNYQVGFVNSPAPGYFFTVSGVFYITPSAGTHRMSVFVYVQTGTLAFRSDIYNNLFVVEQKR